MTFNGLNIVGFGKAYPYLYPKECFSLSMLKVRCKNKEMLASTNFKWCPRKGDRFDKLQYVSNSSLLFHS